MPELPEVETLRRGLQQKLVGRRVVDVEVRLPKMVRSAPSLGVADLVGRDVEFLDRRAKMLIVHLTGGISLIIHLKLSGQLVLRCASQTEFAGGHPVPAYDAPLPHKATHVTFHLDGDRTLFFTDIRQFGYIQIIPTGDVSTILASKKLGPEPFDPSLDVADFRRRVARFRRSPLKTTLLNQSFVSGLGNIYADEALHGASIHPERIGGSLAEPEHVRLLDSIREVLQRALDEGVAEIINGRASELRHFPRVHGRRGRPCYECGTVIERVKLNGRSTYYCPTCQPATELSGQSE